MLKSGAAGELGIGVGVGVAVGVGGDGDVGDMVGVGSGDDGVGPNVIDVFEPVRGVALPPQASNMANIISTQTLVNTRLVLLIL